MDVQLDFFYFISLQQIKDELIDVVTEIEKYDFQEDIKTARNQKTIGRKKFNMDPKKGKILFNLNWIFFIVSYLVCIS